MGILTFEASPVGVPLSTATDSQQLVVKREGMHANRESAVVWSSPQGACTGSFSGVAHLIRYTGIQIFLRELVAPRALVRFVHVSPTLAQLRC
jgi:hypothetical protein